MPRLLAVLSLLFAVPLAAQRPTWRLIPERVIAPEPGSRGELGTVRSIVADRTGTVFVLQQAPVTIRVFDADGRWRRDIGREGEGPGEFEGGALALVRDTLVVHHGGRLVRFTTAGAAAGVGRGRCCWLAARLPGFPDGTVGLQGQAGGRSYGLFFTRLDGTVVDSALFPLPPIRAPGVWVAERTIGGQVETMRVRIPLFPATHAAWLPDRTLVTGSTGTAVVAITTPRHDTIRTIRIAAPAIPLAAATRDALFRAAVASEGEAWEPALRKVARPDQLPDRWPAWTGLATDDASRIWIARPGPAGEVAWLDVYAADGRPLATVAAPHPHILEGYWSRDRVHLADEDADGNPVIRVYRLQR